MSGTGLVRVRGCLKGRYSLCRVDPVWLGSRIRIQKVTIFSVPLWPLDPESGICFVLFYFEGSGRRKCIGDSIFYCASLSLYYFMFPALLHRADAGDRYVGTHQLPERSVPVFFIFFPDPKWSSLYRVNWIFYCVSVGGGEKREVGSSIADPDPGSRIRCLFDP